MDLAAFILMVASFAMFAFASLGRELRKFNEISLGLVFLTGALILQFTAATGVTIGN